MEGGAKAMDWLATALESCTTLFTWVINLVTSNALLAIVFACGTLVPAGIGIFRKIKHAAKQYRRLHIARKTKGYSRGYALFLNEED